MTLEQKTEIKLAGLAELAVDGWRLQKWLDKQPSDNNSLAVPKHFLRRLNKFLESAEIWTVDPEGQIYDIGLAAEIVDTEQDESLDDDRILISETISPLIMINNHTFKHAQIVIKQKSVPPQVEV